MSVPLTSPYRTNRDRELERQVLECLRMLSFGALEQAVCYVLQSSGYRDVRIVGNTHWRGRSDIGGVDIIAWLPKCGIRTKTLVQVKALEENQAVQRRFVDELRGASLRLAAPQSFIFTTRDFSSKAIDAAEIYPGRPVQLVHGDRLARLMVKHGLGVRIKPLPVQSLPVLVVDGLFFERLEELASQ